MERSEIRGIPASRNPPAGGIDHLQTDPDYAALHPGYHTGISNPRFCGDFGNDNGRGLRMATERTGRVDRPALVIGIVLLAIAGIVAWDTSRMTITATYGIGPEAMPYVIAIFIAILGVGHLFVALREGLPAPDEADYGAIGWIGGGLAGLLATIALGGGFIVGTAILFALTARAFGRKALAIGIGIGLAIGLFIFFVFTHLLTLPVPQGPIERLLS
jgi:putative tricarboxylic transport membrane protein